MDLLRQVLRTARPWIAPLVTIAATLCGILFLNSRMARASCNPCGTPIWADAKVRVPGGAWQDSITICTCEEVEFRGEGGDTDNRKKDCKPVDDTGRSWWEYDQDFNDFCIPGTYTATFKQDDKGAVCDEAPASDTVTIRVLDCCPPGVSAALPAPTRKSQRRWTAAVEDVATRHHLRIVSFTPKYSLPPFEAPDPAWDAARAVNAVAVAAYGVAIRVGPDVWTIAPQCTPDQPPAILLARFLEGAASGPAVTDMLLIPFALREQAAEPNRLPLSQLPREARAALPTVRDERDREPDAVSLYPGGFLTVEYRGHAVLATRDMFYHARRRGERGGENRKEARADKYASLAEIDAPLAAQPKQAPRTTWKDWITPLTVGKSLRTLKQVVAALNASRLPKRVILDSHLSDDGALVTPGTYAAGELLWLVRDACCVAIEEGADAVSVTWDRSCMDRLWQGPHDWQQRKYWEMVFQPFLSHAGLQDLAKPFTLQEFMDFRVIPWSEATAEQRAFVLQLLAEHGEHPRAEQEPHLVLFLSPGGEYSLSRQGKFLGGAGLTGYVAQPQATRRPR